MSAAGSGAARAGIAGNLRSASLAVKQLADASAFASAAQKQSFERCASLLPLVYCEKPRGPQAVHSTRRIECVLYRSDSILIQSTSLCHRDEIRTR